MHLERIEIMGFKSFADKTTIVFDQGVTAVVGPNGSGKSNLSEAIRWVLGEQSAKSLRGKKMDDIIFAGSQSRKATNIAEVTLVLNNDDHFLPLDVSQIQITRRLNRNGESECFINKKPCRLKDIVNLLMDSGLGKESFSIISQGKVETIFQNKPEERRGMFEEVAGVLKYKTRKNEAFRKLEKTQEHLNRVEDILFEIHNQLEPLQRQKEKAQLYLEKKEALSHVDIALMVAEIDATHAQLNVVNDQMMTLEQSIEGSAKQKTDFERTIRQLRQTVEDTDKQLSQLQDDYVKIVQSVENYVGQQKVLTERLHFSKHSKGQQDEAIFEKQQQLQTIQKAITQHKQDKLTRQEAIKIRQMSVQQLQENYRVLTSDTKETLEEERQKYIDILQLQTRLQNENTQASRTLEQLQLRKTRVTEQHDALCAEQKRLEQDIAKNSDKHGKLEQTLTQLRDQFLKYEQIDKELQHQKQHLAQKLQQAQQDKHVCIAKRNSLKDLSEDYAGYYQGVREILKQKQRIDGTHGAVAELINVPKQYTTAIDIALGASLQHVVVDNESVATQGIQFLKQKQLGRATFLPLTVIKAKVMPNDILKTLQKQDGYIGIASELIDCQPQYNGIITNALGQTIVAKTISQAIVIAKAIQHRYRIVTIDGEVLHAGGSMTGGGDETETIIVIITSV